MYDPINISLEVEQSGDESDIDHLLELLDRQVDTFISNAESILTCNKQFSDEAKLTRDEILGLKYNLSNVGSLQKLRIKSR
jgi:hypothetical protein